MFRQFWGSYCPEEMDLTWQAHPPKSRPAESLSKYLTLKELRLKENIIMILGPKGPRGSKYLIITMTKAGLEDNVSYDFGTTFFDN